MQIGGILNIIIGLVFIAGGLSGKLAIIGTNNGAFLAIAGGVLIIWGVYRLKRARSASSEDREKNS